MLNTKEAKSDMENRLIGEGIVPLLPNSPFTIGADIDMQGNEIINCPSFNATGAALIAFSGANSGITTSDSSSGPETVISEAVAATNLDPGLYVATINFRLDSTTSEKLAVFTVYNNSIPVATATLLGNSAIQPEIIQLSSCTEIFDYRSNLPGSVPDIFITASISAVEVVSGSSDTVSVRNVSMFLQKLE